MDWGLGAKVSFRPVRCEDIPFWSGLDQGKMRHGMCDNSTLTNKSLQAALRIVDYYPAATTKRINSRKRAWAGPFKRVRSRTRPPRRALCLEGSAHFKPLARIISPIGASTLVCKTLT
jgi:hypothetical protein